MYRTLLLLSVLLVGDVSAKSLHFTVDLLKTNTKRVAITLEMEMMGAEIVYYQMPAWAPGAYAVTNYGRFIENFKAYGYDGREKPVERINENRWRILHGKDIRKITYEVTNSYKDSTSLYFALAHVDSTLVFANATALFGYVNDRKDLAADITYRYPQGWEVQTPLDSVAGPSLRSDGTLEAQYRASNYDELADCPLMAGPGFQHRSFRLGKTRYDVVVTSDREFEMDSLAYYTKRIIEAQLDFFRDTPFVNYKFLINAPTFLNLPRKDQGALEHANSSAYLLVNVPWPYVRESFCHIISHEFFHSWNVKRIHSTKLGPFDYTKAVKTKELWLAEGVTDYYAHMLLNRYGILAPISLGSNINYLYEAILESQPTKVLSLEELSLAESNFDIDNALQFYTRGTLCGFMLDVELRSRTDNRKSLDDVMIALNNEAKKGKRYRDDELMRKISKITGVDIGEFYRKYIAGTASYPVDDYLRMLGVARRVRFTEKSGVSLRIHLDTSRGSLIIDSLYEQSPLPKIGISIGDTILRIGTMAATPSAYTVWTTSHDAPYSERFVFGTPRGRIETQVELTLARRSSTRTLEAGVMPETTKKQDLMRHAIFGSHFNFIGWKDDSATHAFETNVRPPKE